MRQPISSKRIAPIVMLTAFRSATSSSGPNAGAMAYLVKPFSITDLIPAIEVTSRFGESLEQGSRDADGPSRDPVLVSVRRVCSAKQGMTEPEAFKWIQRAAMDRRTTMKRCQWCWRPWTTDNG
jgi:response regulator NasT